MFRHYLRYMFRMSAQHVAIIPVYVRTHTYIRWNFAGEDILCLLCCLPLVRRAYRRSRSISVLFSRDLRLIRASPQLLIELWNCILIHDDVAVVVVVENGCKRRRRAAALTRVHNSFFFLSSFFSFPLPFFCLFFFSLDEIASRGSRYEKTGVTTTGGDGWRSYTGRYTRKKKEVGCRRGMTSRRKGVCSADVHAS